MLKPEELLPMEVWTFVLSKLSTKDELSCRCVCVSFKKDVDSILNNNKDRLWLRQRDDDFAHYFCYDKDHRISSRDTLYFDGMICIKNLEFVSSLMPSLKILQLDPPDPYNQENWNVYEELNYVKNDLDYHDKKCIAVPITKIFPQVTCLILPGATEKKNFTGDLSQVKHLTLFDGVEEGLPKFPNLDSLEVRKYTIPNRKHLPMPSKRFVVPHATIEWRNLPKTLEVIETELNCNDYISVAKPHFENLKILKGLDVVGYDEDQYLETLINFLKDYKGSLTELSFSVEEEVANIKVLIPLLTQLQKLSVRIQTDKQAFEFKAIKALAHNLQYFELSFRLLSGTEKHLGPILENLPTGLDNFSIENVYSYKEIDTFMEQIIEKVENGDTTRVTIADMEDYEYYTNDMIESIVKIKPGLVRVEKTNIRVVVEEGTQEYRYNYFCRTQFPTYICDIVISL